MVRPRSCRVIYYFDTPILGRRHQLFGRVTNLKHIILSKPLLSLFIFSLLYPCVSLNFLYVFLFPWPRISRAYTCWYLMGLWLQIMWEKKWWLMKRMGKVAKGERNKKEKKKRKENGSIVFLKFYVDGVWNQMKLGIGA